eukprot:jgi/Antlo1/1049/1408
MQKRKTLSKIGEKGVKDILVRGREERKKSNEKVMRESARRDQRG